ncbi:LON peptidase substrate-binding domain-containing protein [Thalassoglobus polymorphus]|uniref:ATP-dependent protease La (LON) domain protein n=1 Tax=Thalassoglobus polymorphus TaxID=2527994 RepID=A0A517QHD1_9PLAN|nr:LON peptidase substrate-binding domain-containing protein [Thalassoglobus polymorphus]QDT31043.1 ATP-dependent protease La (LON) domain protein [Thalassoglobus polymorphus]
MQDASTAPICTTIAATNPPTLCLSQIPILPGLALPLTVDSRQLNDTLHNLWTSTRQVILVPTATSNVGCLTTLIAFDGNSGQAHFRGIRRIHLETSCSKASMNDLVEQRNENSSPHRNRANQRELLIEAFLNRFPEHSRNPLVTPLWERELSFGALCDLFAFSCQLNHNEHETILNELDEDRRCELVLNMLKSERPAFQSAEFPPPFSLN